MINYVCDICGKVEPQRTRAVASLFGWKPRGELIFEAISEDMRIGVRFAIHATVSPMSSKVRHLCDECSIKLLLKAVQIYQSLPPAEMPQERKEEEKP